MQQGARHRANGQQREKANRVQALGDGAAERDKPQAIDPDMHPAAVQESVGEERPPLHASIAEEGGGDLRPNFVASGNGVEGGGHAIGIEGEGKAAGNEGEPDEQATIRLRRDDRAEAVDQQQHGA